ncbi:efflux transporter outer membrane subunit [Methylobacter sp. S3L5C]|uniref:efflux transporter outer membrane subunit n=1 Tax=Methylobacter sp. S3L5C TaxID=2839024 RepID=UPI001FACD7D8|nr:efflux transporter outer membrane subunit [Methylobacter sp. S3L5C]UOA06922.1 efflux transporter outer membrane subunit [Methylobacter sp. S3L5C]
MKRCLIMLPLTFLVWGCTVGPDYQRPVVATPKQWTETVKNRNTGLPDNHTSSILRDQWWQSFNDPILNRLITDAIAANLDLKQALVRVKDARAQRWVTITAGLPSITGKSNVSRRLNNSSASGQTGGTPGAVGGSGFGNQIINIFQSGFDAQWELDFFGGERRAIEAADANVDSAIENSRDVMITLLGEVASNYIQLRTNQQLIAITRENLYSQQETARLTQIRQQAGFASMLEVAQAQSQTATTEAFMPMYETVVNQSIHSLSVLLAREPNALALRLDNSAPIPVMTSLVIADLPSELLLRRPDIRYAERKIAEANANVGVATAELYPRVNLSAFIGLQNTRITDFTPIGKSWSTASSLTLPIFNWGRINANIKSKNAQFDLAFLSYQSTVLTAFKEVEDALVAYKNEQHRHQALAQAVAASELAVQMADERYSKGLSMFLDVLQTQQALFQAQRNLVDSEAQLSNDLVALYKALGGGWQTEVTLSDAIQLQK